MNHLQVERLSFVNVVQVFHGDDEAELQDGQTCEHGQISLRTLTPPMLRGRSLPPCSMFALASVKHSRLASSRSDVLRVGLEAETRLRQNIWREDIQNQASAVENRERGGGVVPAEGAASGSLCWSSNVSEEPPAPVCPHTASEKHAEVITRVQNARYSAASANIGPAHLHAAVPVPGKPSVREVVWQPELGSDPLQVLSQRRAAQQVDLTVREARFHPFLQQLQDILEEGET